MTSSPESIAAWTPPDLSGALAGSLAARAGNGAPGNQGLADGDSATATAWSLPELAMRTAGETAIAPRQAPEDEAYGIGLADGLRQGEARAADHLRPVIEALFKLMEEIDASRARFVHDRERNLRGLALVVANQLLQRQVAADPTVVRDLVARALELLPNATALEVRLHPEDLEALSPELDRIATAGRAIAIQWSADRSLQRGGFLIESPLRLIDGRTDVALRTLFERLEND